MNEYAELEIGLHRREAGVYTLDFRFSQPDSEADIRLGQDQDLQASIDLEELQNLTLDAKAYSQKLTADFFSDPNVKSAFAQAQASAQSLNLPLRLRLLIGPSAPELQSLRWETLYDLQGSSPVALAAP